MDRASSQLERDVLARLAALPHGKANYKQLIREMSLKGDERRVLESALNSLALRGDVIELRNQTYVLPQFTQEYFVGRLRTHRDGYGFVIPDVPAPGIRGDLFLPPGAARKAMSGDRVLARVTHVSPDGRAEGEILRILRRAHPTVVGEFRLGKKTNFVIPRDTRLVHSIIIPEGMEIPEQIASVDRIGVAPVQVESAEDLHGKLVNVELLEFPGEDEDGVGRIVEVLGHPDDFGVDVEVTIRKHHLRHRFPPEVLEEAQSVSPVISAHDLLGRTDFRHYDIVTIDGETARDFDDAVWVNKLDNGNFALHVHIADVSHYIHPGSPIDQEAYQRGTSVYFPDRAVPMLPLELSTEICSLKPSVDRLTMSALMEIDHRGDIIKAEFCRSVIRSRERMTYTNVNLVLEGDAGLCERYKPLLGRFELMKELQGVLNRKRVRRGSIDFDLPEPLLIIDEAGLMTGVTRAERNIAHRIIEEFMLVANEAVSTYLEQKLPESVFRIHERPDPQRVLEFEQIASRFGYSLGLPAVPVKKFPVVDKRRDGRKSRKDIVRADDRLEISSRMYQKLVAKLEGRPEERIVSFLMLRSLKQARYSTENVGHFALAADSYTHFTSPIRRYPDLLVHRLLGSLLDEKPLTIPALPQMTDHCSETERRAADAERDLLEWKKIRFMADKVGEEFDALVINAMKPGFFVELNDFFVEGFVPVDTLPGEKWSYHENTRSIIASRSRKEIRVGDRIKVILDRADAVENKLIFSLVVPEAAKRRQPGRSHSRRRQ